MPTFPLPSGAPPQSYVHCVDGSFFYNSSTSAGPSTAPEQAVVSDYIHGATVPPRLARRVVQNCRFPDGGTRQQRIRAHQRQAKVKQTWIPKSESVSEDRTSASPNSRSDVVIHPQPVEGEGAKSTLMIRNIPSKYSRQMLMSFLDEHCMKENEKLKRPAGAEEDSLLAFDFLYLPMDFKRRLNKGYAFVNFTNANAASRLHVSLNKYKWEVFKSQKICEIAYAKIQGSDALIKHFQKSTFVCDSEDYLPVHFIPARDGSGSWVSQRTIGKRIHPSLQIDS
uniref:RRM domain-containing protein n=1 Tax=Nelumbo nucifera TaxID=4432 RepID=A0A822ZYC3_NELNU|nr:TPA_asm: hypothetical protein HUJ06_016865 [Nelumbo nucifera]